MGTTVIGNYGGAVASSAAPPGSEKTRVAPSPTPATAAAQAQKPSAPSEQPSREQVQQAVEEVRKSINQNVAKSLNFALDDETGRMVVRITDTDTGELIRQIPSEEMLELAKAIDRMQGSLLRQQV